MAIGKSGKDKRPKFLLEFQIKELVNVPQSGGVCYVKWNLKDGTGTSDTTVTGASGESVSVSNVHRGITNKVSVKRHRAQWNYKLEKPMHVKLHLDKYRKFVPKLLYLEVYFEFTDNKPGAMSSVKRDDNGRRSRSGSGNTDSGRDSPIAGVKNAIDNQANNVANAFDLKRFSLDTNIHTLRMHPSFSSVTNGANCNSNYTQRTSGKVLLGTVKINITEYIKEDESPISNRFLLNDSKVNSILNMTLKMKLTRGSYQDFIVPNAFTSGQLSTSFRGELTGILDGGSERGSPTSSPIPSTLFSNSGTGTSGVGTRMSSSTQRTRFTNTISAAMSPLVDTLYQKTFQLPWDPRPGEFTPRECVDDILNGGSGWARNEKGVNLIDIEALKINEMEEEYYAKRNVSRPESSTKTAYHSKDGRTCEKMSEKDLKGFNNMDTREFMEKKREWSKLSQAQRERLRNDDTEDEKGGSPENYIIEGMKEARSWTIKQPVF